MNISRFKKLNQSRKESIGANVADKVVTEWNKKRRTDLKELSRSIDVDNVKIDTEGDIFGIKQSLPPSSGPHVTEIFHEFCEDIITEIVVSV